MVRIIIGAVVAAVAMFVIGFIFFATPLKNLALANLDDAPAAAVQNALAANLPRTGTYAVPGVDTPAQTNMYSRGPIATVHYNTSGFGAEDPAALIKGFVFNIVIALLIGLALAGIGGRVTDFASRARAAVILAVAGVAFSHLSEPIYLHHDWTYLIYVFVADSLMLLAAGLILAWFLPGRDASAAPADAPTEV